MNVAVYYIKIKLFGHRGNTRESFPTLIQTCVYIFCHKTTLKHTCTEVFNTVYTEPTNILGQQNINVNCLLRPFTELQNSPKMQRNESQPFNLSCD